MGSATAVQERPIPFSGPMVRAILDGRKSQTRRVVKPQPTRDQSAGGLVWAQGLSGQWGAFLMYHVVPKRTGWIPRDYPAACPYGAPGGRLWVRETFARMDGHDPENVGADAPVVAYRADDAGLGSVRWTSPRFMPRWASRLTLEVTAIRLERLQDITDADARAEGVAPMDFRGTVNGKPSTGTIFDPLTAFRATWDTLNLTRGYGWASNPWVWVIEFRPAPSQDAAQEGENG